MKVSLDKFCHVHPYLTDDLRPANDAEEEEEEEEQGTPMHWCGGICWCRGKYCFVV